MIYSINKGSHYSGFRFNLNWNKMGMTKQVTFFESCRYVFDDEDRFDINKLFGFSQGLHHKNSARFGWLYNPHTDMIELHAYCYVDGKRTYKYITCINIGQVVTLNIICVGNKYEFTVKINSLGHTYQTLIDRNRNVKKWGYDLFPYFGGNKTAPHKMEISLEK